MGDSLYYKIYILFSNLFNIQYNYIVTNTIINIKMKKTIASFTYKSEEMNLDLVELLDKIDNLKNVCNTIKKINKR